MNDPYNNIRFRLISILASCEWVTFEQLRDMYIAKHQPRRRAAVELQMICDAAFDLQHSGLAEIDERLSEPDLVRGLFVPRVTHHAAPKDNR